MSIYYLTPENGLLLPWIPVHYFLSLTPVCVWKGTKEMQVVAVTHIDHQWSHKRQHNKVQEEEISFLFPFTPLN